MFLDVTLEPRKEKKEEQVAKKQYDWTYENNINYGKTLIDLDSPQEFKYAQWRTNISLSYHIDTLIDASIMNMAYSLDDKLHYHYLFYSVRKKKRYGAKKTDADKQLEKQLKDEQRLLALIQEYYKYNIVRAKEVLKILSKEHIDFIIKKQEKGGIK